MRESLLAKKRFAVGSRYSRGGRKGAPRRLKFHDNVPSNGGKVNFSSMESSKVESTNNRVIFIALFLSSRSRYFSIFPHLGHASKIVMTENKYVERPRDFFSFFFVSFLFFESCEICTRFFFFYKYRVIEEE